MGVLGTSGILTGDCEPSDADDSNIVPLPKREVGMLMLKGFVLGWVLGAGDKAGEDGEGVRGGREDLVNEE